ncbi:MAG: hypothetical protein M5U34_47360 [Chloroflexi bacterium]|nr:hypothetical protein [Chloroflexota bacterium]
MATPVVAAVTSMPSPPVAAAAPKIYETTITIPTYGYEVGFQPTSPEDDIYPYPRLNFDLVGSPIPRSYKGVVLENGFVSITILPELGDAFTAGWIKAPDANCCMKTPSLNQPVGGIVVGGWRLAASSGPFLLKNMA